MIAIRPLFLAVSLALSWPVLSMVSELEVARLNVIKKQTFAWLSSSQSTEESVAHSCYQSLAALAKMYAHNTNITFRDAKEIMYPVFFNLISADIRHDIFNHKLGMMAVFADIGIVFSCAALAYTHQGLTECWDSYMSEIFIYQALPAFVFGAVGDHLQAQIRKKLDFMPMAQKKNRVLAILKNQYEREKIDEMRLNNVDAGIDWKALGNFLTSNANGTPNTNMGFVVVNNS